MDYSWWLCNAEERDLENIFFPLAMKVLKDNRHVNRPGRTPISHFPTLVDRKTPQKDAH